MRRFIRSILGLKATAKLEKEVEEELNIPDPSPEKVEALLKDEKTKKHDGRASS